MAGPKKEQELLLGTLDMLILKTLVMGPAHGHTIAHAIENTSDEVLQIEQGSLIPYFTGWKIVAGSHPIRGPAKTTARPVSTA